jgi:hypothetical protein
MKYTDVRPDIKTGDVLSWSEGDWKSWKGIQLNLVRMFTRSTYNHVAVAYVVGGRVFVVEAVVPYIRIYPLSKVLPCYISKIPFEATEEMEERMLELVGLPYSKWEAIKSLFTTSTNSESVWECSKLVNDILGKVDDRFNHINDTPAETMRLMTDVIGSSITYIDK